MNYCIVKLWSKEVGLRGACLAFPWAGDRAVGADPADCTNRANSVGKGLADRFGSDALSGSYGYSTDRGGMAGSSVIAINRTLIPPCPLDQDQDASYPIICTSVNRLRFLLWSSLFEPELTSI